MNSRLRACAVALVIAMSCSPAPSTESPADLVITGGRVWTGNPAAPWAAGVAVRGNRIAAVGTRELVLSLAGPETRRLDASGGMVTPGFIDTHVHLMSSSLALSSVQLRDAASPDEFTARIAAFAAAAPANSWIVGGQWDHENWGGTLPRRDWIDAATADHPVAVSRLDGHMLLANTAALAAAGIDAATPDVEGGTIVRDANGTPTGILKDNAMNLIWRVMPDPPAAVQDRALQAGMAFLLERGVTTVHDMGDWPDLEVYERAHAAGSMRVRVYSCVQLPGWKRLRDRIAASGRGDHWLRIGCLKAMLDGSLGSHTAAFHEPFADAPGDIGLLLHDPEQIYRWAAGADAAGLQVALHAIGDRAIDLELDLVERIVAANGPRDRRFRMEHAQHPTRAAIDRFAPLGVIASMQPYHAIDDGRWAERVIGPERARTTYAFRSLLDAGAVVAFGSDWSVAPPTPLEGIYAAVTRRTLDGAHPGGWIPEQRIGVEEALRAYTAAGAFASFEEDDKGTLDSGKLADLVILDRDLAAVPPEQIRDAAVVATIVDGRVEYERRR